MYRQEKYDKFRYIIRGVWKVRLLAVFGLVSWMLVVYGLWRFLRVSPVYLAFFAPVVAYFTLSFGLNALVRLLYRPFSMPRHRLKVTEYWNRFAQAQPEVDILLPICGENTAILQPTFSAVSQLDYVNKKVFVLDDKGMEEHKNLAQTFGFTYLSRENKGQMGKAGNVKYGYERTKGEYVVVLDADQAPHKDFLTDLLPYMEDPQVGMVQAPLYFEASDAVNRRSRLEYGVATLQEDLYRLIQPARARVGAALGQGSNVIYRRKALESIGGPTQVEPGGDMRTGFSLLRQGWRSQYIPLLLAIGLAPAKAQTFFEQQRRRGLAGLNLLMSRLFWAAKVPALARLHYISGFLSYFQPVFLLLLIVLMVAFALRGTVLPPVEELWPFLPFFLYLLVLAPFFRTVQTRLGTVIAWFVRANSWMDALLGKLTSRSLTYKQATSLGIAYVLILVCLPVLAFVYRTQPSFRPAALVQLVMGSSDLSSIQFFASSSPVSRLDRKAPEVVLPHATTTLAALVASTTPSTATASSTPVVAAHQVELVAVRGDSLSVMARKVIHDYNTQQQLQLKEWQMMYLETSLIAEKRFARLEVGEKVLFDTTKIETYAANIPHLYPTQVQKWKQYAVVAGLTHSVKEETALLPTVQQVTVAWMQDQTSAWSMDDHVLSSVTGISPVISVDVFVPVVASAHEVLYYATSGLQHVGFAGRNGRRVCDWV